jgi:anti-sigma factor RsiW
MNCRELEEQLAEDSHAELDKEARLHLEQCEACRALLKDLTALRDLSAELRERAQVPAFFDSRVCSRVGKPRYRFAYWRFLAAASAVVLLSLGIGEFLRETPQLTVQGESPANRGEVENTSEQALIFGVSESPALLDVDPSSGSRMDRPIEVIIPNVDAPGFLLELPSGIEIRQTQAENEFYLRSVSH